ncbi:MAG TPA: hypothetical protein VEX18_20655 [Polyangiaceae bacterium]|nr:hypothetical protein [Polyangiaceae bacterium]
MGRLAASAAVALLLGSLPGRALAAGECPDGDWFCDEAPPPTEPPPEPAAQGEPEPPPPPEPPATLVPDPEPAPKIQLDVPNVQPAKRRRVRHREWGVNIHGTLGLMGDDQAISPDAGMNGFGVALRFRPIPHIAVEGSLELLWGTDYNGFDRFEDAVLVSALFFVNPRSAIQLYGLAGLGVAGAWLDAGDDGVEPRDERYAYVGAQLGFGVEARITRQFVLGGDLLGFLRERQDRDADEQPEFVDPVTHRTSNTSGGGLIRLGATFYW